MLAKGGVRAMKKSDTPSTQLAPLSISDDVEKEQVFLMFLQGWTAADIEGKTGIRQDRIRQWSHRGSWPAKKKQFEELKMEKNPLEQQPIVKAVINSKKGELKKQFIENMGEIAAADAEHWKKIDPEERLVVASNIAALGGLHRKTFDLDKEEEAGSKGHINLTFLSQASEPGMVRVINSAAVRVIEEPASVSTNPDDY